MNVFLWPLYAIYRLFSRSRRWMARRFTKPGIAVFIGLVVSMIVGVDTDNSVAYQGFAFLLFLLVVAVPFSAFFRGRFAAVRLLPRFATAGLPFHYRVQLTNLGRKVQRGLTLLENLDNSGPSFAEWKALKLDEQKHVRPFRISQRRLSNPFKVARINDAAVPPIPANQSVDVQVELTPLRRGLVRLRGVIVARPDPLGLYRSFVKLSLSQNVLVLPKRYPLAPVALPGLMKYQQGGVALASNIGRSDEFVALRDYRRGDPLRHIHWRSWAKTGKPIVKEFEDEFFVRHALVLDTFTPRPYSDQFEEAVSVAASFACAAITEESLLDLLFVGPDAFCFTAGRGLAHSNQMLEVLASVQPCAKRSFATLEHLVMDHAAGMSGCVCVLLAWDEERQNLVAKLKALGVPLRVLVIQAGKGQESIEPGPMRDNPEHLHVLELGRIEEQLAQLT